MTKLLTAEDLSKRLRVPKRSVYKFAQEGLIPGGFRIGRHWRFHEDLVEHWILEQAVKTPLTSKKETDSHA